MTKRCIGENHKKRTKAICANWTMFPVCFPIAIKGRWISIIQLSCSSRSTNHCSYPGYHFPLLLSVNSRSFILIIISLIVYTHHILIHRIDTRPITALSWWYLNWRRWRDISSKLHTSASEKATLHNIQHVQRNC